MRAPVHEVLLELLGEAVQPLLARRAAVAVRAAGGGERRIVVLVIVAIVRQRRGPGGRRRTRGERQTGRGRAVHRGRRPYRAPMGLPRGLSLLDRMATNLAARMHRPRGTIVLYIEAIDLKRNTLYSVPLTNHPPQQPNRARAIFQQYLGRIRPCTRIKTGYPWAA